MLNPPGIPHRSTHCNDINKGEQYHWGININEIIPTYDISVVSRDIELAINGIDQVIESGWGKIKVSVDSATVDTVAPPHLGKSIPLKENEISKNGIKFRAANGTPIAVHGETKSKWSKW